MREKPIEVYLRKQIAKEGGRAYKWVSPGNNGVPDRIVFVWGMIFFVETKASNVKKVDPLQVIQHRELKRLGQDVLVLNSKEKIDEWIAMQKHALGKLTVEARLDNALYFDGRDIGTIWIDENGGTC